ncbi:MAG: alpha/beta fold hydrolase [Candidatus Cyclobacteriaceae bacterium M2_1C_046]
MEYIEHQDWKLFYEKSGDKKQVMLLFHGFGQSHQDMKPLVDQLLHSYTCYNFDLFFHGKSTGPEEKALELEDWNEIMRKLFKKEQIEEVNLTGFSLGAKYVLAILMAFPEKINNLFFLAPDGIKTNIWYNMATYPHFLRKLFKSTIRHPQRFYILIRPLRKLGLISKSLSKFVEMQMSTPDQRVRVYRSWVGIRRIKFKTKKILKVLNKEQLPTTIILGNRDSVIPVKPFKKFCNRGLTCKLVILEAGHNSLIKQASLYISRKISAS